jgi:hypothetical protein
MKLKHIGADVDESPLDEDRGQQSSFVSTVMRTLHFESVKGCKYFV